MRILGLRAVGEHASSAIQAVALLIATNKGIDFIALGGINDLNIKKINLLNCYGFAGISWIKKNGLRKLRPFLNCLNNY